MEKQELQDLIERLNICVNAEKCSKCVLNESLECMIARRNLKKCRDALTWAAETLVR